MSFNAS
jgi:phosphate/sulfate permease